MIHGLRSSLISSCLFLGYLLAANVSPGAEPLVEKYLKEGRLAEGAKVLESRLEKAPTDDEARFGLGFLRTLQAFEHIGGSLYKYGLRTSTGLRFRDPELQRIWRQRENSDTLSYKEVRKILQTWVDDLTLAETTLAKIKDPKVKLPLHVGQIKVDLMGVGEPVSASVVFGQMGSGIPKEQIDQFTVAFDRGDVAWLRGYLHLLSAWGEIALAIDGQEIFDCTAHLFFEKVETPHKFLLEGRLSVEEAVRNFDRPLFSDVIAFIHLMKFPIKEPARMQAALGHLEATLKLAHEMWDHILPETDDDREWIPNPKQTGVVGVKVTEEMITDWKAALDEADLVLQGKRLIPFWRGSNDIEIDSLNLKISRGVNLRRVFTEPRSLDPILWIQGTAATPYLESGKVTKFATPEMFGRLNGTFNGPNFFGFMFWFN